MDMLSAPPPERDSPLNVTDLTDAWPVLHREERARGFLLLSREDQEELFLALPPHAQAELLLALPGGVRRLWMRLLPPDDAADLLQEVSASDRSALLLTLDDAARAEISALLAHAEDEAGGLMNPRFARARPDMSIEEAIRYLKLQARTPIEMMHYAYVLGPEQQLLGVCSLRELFLAAPQSRVSEVMSTDPIAVRSDLDQEDVARLFQRHGYLALPVVDAEGRMQGIVTVDDIVDVVAEEATEDAHKFGGMEALDEPYLSTRFGMMLRKRGGWLLILFIGEMLTASVMSRFAGEIAQAVVLAVFLPLIISSGGNAGSQASTLIVRAMAMGEVRLTDFWRVVRREVGAGVALGLVLGTVGVLRVSLWQAAFHSYGAHVGLLALAVGSSLVGVVVAGTLAGSALRFVLRWFGLDPASASAPLVATVVDLSGLLIYFEVARLVLGATLLG